MKVVIGEIELHVQLGQEKLVVADETTLYQKDVAQRRTVPFAENFRVFRQQLAQQC